MSKPVLLGMLTPSSNTVLEPVIDAMLTDLPEVTAHFSRFRVTEISLGDKAWKQFDLDPMVEAAKLLSDAGVNVIAWNGTSGGWLGFDIDHELCSRITKETGIPATTSILALNEIFIKTGVKKFGLVTPYLHELQSKIIDTFAKEDFACISERHLNISTNTCISEVTAEQIERMVLEVAKTKPDAITIFCTNLRGAPLVERLEHETGIPIYDSVATALWKSLNIADIDCQLVKGWGSLFR